MGLGIEGMTFSQAERENPGCLFRDVAIVEHIPNIQRTRAKLVTQRSFGSPYTKCSGLFGHGHIWYIPSP